MVKETKQVKGVKYTIEYIQRLSDLTYHSGIQDALESLQSSGTAEVVDVEVVIVEE